MDLSYGDASEDPEDFGEYQHNDTDHIHQTGTWAPYELSQLKEAVANVPFGTSKRWIEVAKRVPSRNAKQCAFKWECSQYELEKGSLKTRWQPQEEYVVALMASKLGTRWKMISKKLINRSDNDVKNHWFATSRVKCAARRTTLLWQYIDLSVHQLLGHTPEVFEQACVNYTSLPDTPPLEDLVVPEDHFVLLHEQEEAARPLPPPLSAPIPFFSRQSMDIDKAPRQARSPVDHPGLPSSIVPPRLDYQQLVRRASLSNRVEEQRANDSSTGSRPAPHRGTGVQAAPDCPRPPARTTTSLNRHETAMHEDTGAFKGMSQYRGTGFMPGPEMLRPAWPAGGHYYPGEEARDLKAGPVGFKSGSYRGGGGALVALQPDGLRPLRLVSGSNRDDESRDQDAGGPKPGMECPRPVRPFTNPKDTRSAGEPNAEGLFAPGLSQLLWAAEVLEASPSLRAKQQQHQAAGDAGADNSAPARQSPPPGFAPYRNARLSSLSGGAVPPPVSIPASMGAGSCAPRPGQAWKPNCADVGQSFGSIKQEHEQLRQHMPDPLAGLPRISRQHHEGLPFRAVRSLGGAPPSGLDGSRPPWPQPGPMDEELPRGMSGGGSGLRRERVCAECEKCACGGGAFKEYEGSPRGGGHQTPPAKRLRVDMPVYQDMATSPGHPYEAFHLLQNRHMQNMIGWQAQPPQRGLPAPPAARVSDSDSRHCWQQEFPMIQRLVVE